MKKEMKQTAYQKRKKRYIFLSVFVILFAIVLTVGSIKKYSRTRTNANVGTTIAYMDPQPANPVVGSIFKETVSLTPGGGNQITSVKLVITYDPTILQPDAQGFVVNATQFSQTFEGPTNISCSSVCIISVSVGIGSDKTKVITAPTTIGSINFTALNTTGNSGTILDFQNGSIVTAAYSLSSADEPTINVANFTPKTIIIAPNPSITSTTTPTPTIPVSPTPTSTNFCGQTCSTSADCNQDQTGCGICDTVTTHTCVAAVTQTPTPTVPVTPTPTTPLPTPTPLPSGATVGTLSVHFEGIDPSNNTAPNHPQRQILLQFYPNQSFSAAPLATISALVSYVSGDANGAFINNQIDLSSIPTGAYYVLVKSPEGSLRAETTAQQIVIALGQTISLNGTNSTTPVALRMGDLNGDNTVDINDYNIIVDCYGAKVTAPSCTTHKATDTTKGAFADLNDDGIVNGIDYNIVIRNINNVGF